VRLRPVRSEFRPQLDKTCTVESDCYIITFSVLIIVIIIVMPSVL